MKSGLFRVLMSITCMLALTAIYACDQEELDVFIACEKTYVEPEQLSFLNNGIFIAVDQFWLETSALFADSYGLYFTNYKNNKCKDGEWKCPSCQRCNPNTRGRCPCGKGGTALY